jgi:hypothetical protein
MEKGIHTLKEFSPESHKSDIRGKVLRHCTPALRNINYDHIIVTEIKILQSF